MITKEELKGIKPGDQVRLEAKGKDESRLITIEAITREGKLIVALESRNTYVVLPLENASIEQKPVVLRRVNLRNMPNKVNGVRLLGEMTVKHVTYGVHLHLPGYPATFLDWEDPTIGRIVAYLAPEQG